ncbi:DNA polymerase delta, subunit 4-domain-containing protein [Schizophyllum fasciatum]
MPPTRSTRSSAAPQLKQARLSFTASKRTASANTAKPAKAVAPRTSSTPILSRRTSSSSSSASGRSSSDDTDDDVEIVERPRPTRRRSDFRKAVVVVDEEAAHLDVKDPRWNRAYKEAKELRGTPLVHAEGQNKVHDILRVFDMTYKYGPYVGITRLERWERANNLGLHPPPEIKDILLTQEGKTLDEYAQSAVYGKGDVLV